MYAWMLPSVSCYCESDSPCCSFVCECSLLLHYAHLQVIHCCFLLFFWHWVCMWEFRQKIVSNARNSLPNGTTWSGYCPLIFLYVCFYTRMCINIHCSTWHCILKKEVLFVERYSFLWGVSSHNTLNKSHKSQAFISCLPCSLFAYTVDLSSTHIISCRTNKCTVSVLPGLSG